jgi:hypothetical protein
VDQGVGLSSNPSTIKKKERNFFTDTIYSEVASQTKSICTTIDAGIVLDPKHDFSYKSVTN